MTDPSTQTTNAVLSTFDGSIRYDFLIQPERMRYSPQAIFSSLPVLLTAQPLVKYKYSQTSVSIPDAKLWTDTGQVSVKPQLDTLISWTRPSPDQGVPKLLKFTWGTEVIPRCYLVSFSHQITARMAGSDPTMVTGDLELLLAPEVPAPTVEVPRKLTAREQETYQQKLDSRLERTPGLREQLGLRQGERPTVSEDGRIRLKRDNREVILGDLSAILQEEVRQTLRTPSGS